MKLQFAYKFSGEDQDKVKEMFKKIRDVFIQKGNSVYIPVLDLDNKNRTEKEVFLNTVSKINDSDVLVAIVTSDEKSEGMSLEVGYAAACNKKIILLVAKDVKTRLRFFANNILEFDELDDLLNKLLEVDL